MRAYFEAVEAGSPIVRTDRMEAALAPEHLAALRACGLLRSTGRDPFEEVSLPDLTRVLRALYGIESRGLAVPTRFESLPVPLGWIRDEGGDRDAMLFVGPHLTLPRSFRKGGRALVLVPTARRVSPELRDRCPPGAAYVVEVLDEVLAVRGGRIVRAGVAAPHAADLGPPPAVAAPVSALPSVPAASPPAASRRLPGAPRWNAIEFTLLDAHTVRIDFPGVSVCRSYVDLGMAHARSRQPTRPWQLLVELCEGYGIFLSRAFGDAVATKKLVSRLAAILRDVFGLPDTPFHPYRPKEGWRAKFVAHPKRRD